MKRLRRLDDAGPLIRERKPFTSGLRKTPYGEFTSMRGFDNGTGPDGIAFSSMQHGFATHYLPEEYHQSLAHATYAVYSFDTAMAWWLEQPPPGSDVDTVERWLANGEVGFWVMPSVSYSMTTGNHQSLIASAIDPGTVVATEWVPYTFDPTDGYEREIRSFTTEFRQRGYNYKHKYKNRGDDANGPSVERTWY